MFQLVFMAVMAKLLDRAVFGLIAVANYYSPVFSYFVQIKITSAFIQIISLSDGDVRTILALSLDVSN